MIAFICALPQEAAHLRKLSVVQNGQATLICSGVGPRNAERATREQMEKSRPHLVISTGVAGSLSRELKIGDVIVANEVIDESSGSHFKCSPPPNTQNPESMIVSVSRMITSADEKKSLWQKFNAVAVDMESAAVARVCVQHNVPFVAIRAISDTAEEVLPPALTGFFDEQGKLRPSKIAAAIVKNPALVKTLRRLQKQTAIAGESLVKFLSEHPMTE